MANIKVDSELMLHMMPAEPISSTRRFISVRDEDGRPLLFSISTEGQFIAIKANGEGSNIQVNIGDILGLRGEVDAFNVTQSSNAEGTLFITFATKESAKSSHLHVLKPMKPRDLNLPSDEFRKKLLLAVEQPANARIKELHMNSATDSTPPLLVPVYHDVNDDVQIARIAISATNWTWKRDIAIPELAKKFIALRTGKVPLGEGLFVLYEGGNKKPSLMFITTDDPDDTTVVDCGFPAGAEPSSVSTFTDDKGDGNTGIFIAGNGLFLFHPEDFNSSGNIARQVSSDPIYHDIQNIFIAQAGNHMSAWFETEDHSLGYQRATNNGKLVGAPTLLLPAGSNAEFAPIIDPSSSSQILVILDDNSQLSLLEQSIDTEVWSSTPFLFERQEKMTEISAYVTHIEITDANKSPLPLTQFRLASTAWVTVLVNGVFRTIPTKGATVQTDARGVITLVVPSADMSCYTFTLRDVDGASHLPSGGVSIDPSSKVTSRLSAIKSVSDLKNYKTGNGALLLAGSTASEDDIKNAAGAIAEITKIKFDKPSAPPSGAMGFAAAAAPVPWHGPAILSSVVTGSAGSSSASKAKSLGSEIKQAFWSAWEWVKRQANKAKDWFISKVNDAWHFIVDIAGKAWAFILDGWNAVVKAATFIFEKLKVAWNAVVDAFGFIFNWGDIKKTRDSIKVMVNSCFDFGSTFILNNKPKVEKVFNDMEAAVLKGLKLDDLPGDVKDKKQTPDSAQKDQPKNADASSSAPANVSTYHFEQAKKSSSRLEDASVVLRSTYNKVVKPVIDDLGNQISGIAGEIAALIARKDGVSAADVFKTLGAGLVKMVIGLIKNVVLGLMEVASDILLTIKSVLNWTVHIPVVTPILEWLGVPKFSLLDAVSLLLAMPVTVLAKIITGEAPARIQAFDYSAMVSGTLDKESLLAYNDLASYLSITYSIYDTISSGIKMFTSTVSEPPKAISLGSLLMKMIVQAATFPYDKESPGRDWRVAVWSMLTVNQIISAIALKTGLPVTKLLAATDIFMALSTFALTQVVHAEEYKVNKDAAGHARTSLSLAKSIYSVVGEIAGGYGTIAPDPVQKGICLVVVTAANTSKAVISTGDKVIAKAEKK